MPPIAIWSGCPAEPSLRRRKFDRKFRRSASEYESVQIYLEAERFVVSGAEIVPRAGMNVLLTESAAARVSAAARERVSGEV
jgi:hypothetical protein